VTRPEARDERDGGDGHAALVGALASELAAELAAPMQGLRDRLALLVDHIERYISHSTGPTPYPWQSLQGLRGELGGAYLEATLLVRQLGDIQAVLAPSPAGAASEVDAAHEVEVALGLLGMKHPSAELIADVRATPPVRAAAGALGLLLTRLLWLCAESVREAAGSAISLRTWAEPGDGAGERTAVVIAIADNGHGAALSERESRALLSLVESWHGHLDLVVAPGHGCAFELRLVAAAAG
jgi:signal transduction histidine kinase